jgi:hypothetical protein
MATNQDVRASGFRRIRATTAGLAIAAVAGSVAVAGAAYAATNSASSTATTTSTSNNGSTSNDGSTSGTSSDNSGLVGSTDQAPQAHSGGS